MAVVSPVRVPARRTLAEHLMLAAVVCLVVVLFVCLHVPESQAAYFSGSALNCSWQDFEQK